MADIRDYLPMGSVVLLEGGIKKLMIIGIMPESQEEDGTVRLYDYLGVTYPEGFLSIETLLLFNHEQIDDVIYQGYDSPERSRFLEKVVEKTNEMKREME